MWYRFAKIWNPYEDEFRRTKSRASLDDDEFYGFHPQQERLVQEYAFGIPDEQSIRTLIKYGPIAEMGAGRGYWKAVGDKLMQDEDPDNFDPDFWKAYDLDPEKFLSKFQPGKQWSNVLKGGSKILADYPDRTALFIWPPWGNSMAYEGLKAHSGAGGEKVGYCGEEYGCTADDKFHDLLNADYEKIDEVFNPRYHALHDKLGIYKRK
jgi:hypothetical protein